MTDLDQKYISVSVLKKALSEDELSKLATKYVSARDRYGQARRGTTLNVPVTKKEKRILKSYLKDGNTSLRDLEKDLNITKGTMGQKAGRVALKLLFQNPAIAKKLL